MRAIPWLSLLNVTQVSVGAMSYANSLGNDVIAMHVSTEETKVKDAEVAEEFKRYFPHIRFEMSWPVTGILSSQRLNLSQK